MDDLLQHCVRELAFDGDLGCSVLRLRSFVEAFYASQNSVSLGKQRLDNSFHAFVWALLVRQPSVHVGLVPKGRPAEVYIAPQPSKRTKTTKPSRSKSATEGVPSRPQEAEDAGIDEGNDHGYLQTVNEASAISLDALIEQYGDALRVAVDPKTSFRAITGSHTRPAKLSAMVYTTLQLISRGREGGLSVVDLGKKTSYDQKTCFYLIKQLLELDLIVKLSKGGAGGGNFCVHKYFYTRSPFWEGIREEVGEKYVEDGLQQGRNEDEDSMNARRMLQFDPIDSRHLTSIELIKSRLQKLLRHSENGLHMYNNLLIALGFSNPTKSERRFFITRIRELIKEGFIEKVLVPKIHGRSNILCVRLVKESHTSDDGTIIQPVEVGDDDQEATAFQVKEGDAPVVNMTIHRQILKLLEGAGHYGLSIQDMSSRLGNMNRQKLELFLSRLERTPPPPHLADLATCDFIEHRGRARQHRYYTLRGYFSFIHKENIDYAGRIAQYTSIDSTHSGDFFLLTEDLFYKDRASLVVYEDEFRGKSKGGTSKVGRPRKDDTTSNSGKHVSEGDETRLPRRRGRPKKTIEKTVETRSDTKTAGESQSAEQKVTQRGRKRKRNIDVEDGVADSQPPSKKVAIQTLENAGGRNTGTSDSTKAGGAVTSALMLPQIRGRTSEKPLLGHVEKTHLNVPRDELPRDEPKSHTGYVLSFPPAYMGTQQSATFIEEPSAGPSGTSFIDNSTANDSLCETEIMSDRLHPVPVSADTMNQTYVTTNPSGDSKRKHDLMNDEEESGTPPSKRSRSGRNRSHALVNISQMRAENEFMRVVEVAGGIVNITSKEFVDAHSRIIATMVEAGEATSTPVGVQPDRRTIRKIFDRLEERGRLKSLTVNLSPFFGQTRPVKIAYEPGVSQQRLDYYLNTIREGIPAPTAQIHKKLEQPTGFTGSMRHQDEYLRLARGDLVDGTNVEEIETRYLDISKMDDHAVHTSILTEIRTVAQLYGFLFGRVARARELHLFTLSHFQGTHHSTHFVSEAERIVTLSYYYNDLPVSAYFAIISATEYNQELSTLMQTDLGRQTPVKDLPPDLHDKLKIGRARSRDRILRLLIILTSLKLVTPLQPSTSGTPFCTCEANGEHPTRFDIVPISDTRYTVSSPLYWRFNTMAPIYSYSMTTPWPPLFCNDMSVRTAEEGTMFWLELKDACLNNVEPVISTDSVTGPCVCTLEVARALRRSRSWTSSYVLSWQQKMYLQRTVDPSTRQNPLSDSSESGRDYLSHICNIISAPIEAVQDFFTNSRSTFVKRLGIVHQGERKRQHLRWKDNSDRALLANKAAEARRQFEADWDSLVQRVHPSPLPYGCSMRLKQLRTQYLQSRASMDNQKWEAAVLEAISGARSSRRRSALSNIAATMPQKRGGVPHLPSIAPPKQSVKELIERQNERLAAFQATPEKKKRRGKGKDHEGGRKANPESTRRQRFQWTSEYDELARDASAIIRSRCRTWHRMDWTALDQIFPFLSRNNVRQRIVMLRQEAGAESYLRLLEDKWHYLWVTHRGTEALPDDDPTHPSEFDAITHVEFLRGHIDKRALRVGLSETDSQHAAGPILMSTIPDFLSKWTVVEKSRPSNKMDVVWNAIGDEHREKAFLGETFSLTPGLCDEPPLSHSSLTGVAESGLKMVLGTPEEDYDMDIATSFLGSIGEDAVRETSEKLLARGVVSISGKSRLRRPGRKLKISSLNDDALGGSYHSGFYAEACAIDEMRDERDWREWSLIASDGEMAALIDLVSARKVEFQIDVFGPVSQLQLLDWNSKKVDDEQITTTPLVRFHQSWDDAEPLNSPPESPLRISSPMDVDETISVEHGQSNGEPAPCRKTSQGVITCSACIDTEQGAFLTNLDLECRVSSLGVLEKLDNAGWRGLSCEALKSSQLSIEKMTSTTFPQCYWVGYTSPALVSRRHIAKWTVPILGGLTPKRVFPRRWLNIKGDRMENVWNAGLRAVISILLSRTGIPLSELRQRLISVYDRQELNDLLQHLADEGIITKMVPLAYRALQNKDIRALDAAEEQRTCWELTSNHWYRVNER